MPRLRRRLAGAPGRQRYATVLALVLMSLAPSIGIAQRIHYVTDQFELGLYAAAAMDGEPIETLVSGTELVLLEQNAGMSHVRTATGTEGWVRSEFLTEAQPAALTVLDLEQRLAELSAEREAVEAQIEQYRGTLPWPWVVGAVGVAFGFGFLAGYLWLDASIRRKHGGFRPY